VATTQEIGQVLAAVKLSWPHSSLGDDLELAIATWHRVLGGYRLGEIFATVDRLAISGRDHAPAPGVVVNAIERERQGEPPSFEDAYDAMWRALPQRVFLRTVHEPTGRYAPEATARAVALMQAGGAHEAVLRLVQDRGLRAIVTLPHGDDHALDANQAADHRDMARHYRDQVVVGWRENPKPGLALERACRTAQLDAGEVLRVAVSRRAELVALPALPALPASEVEPDDDGELVDPGEVTQAITRMAVAARMRESDAEAATAAAREAARAARRAAEAQLAEHTRQRDGSSR
jgi:hypothetical protein